MFLSFTLEDVVLMEREPSILRVKCMVELIPHTHMKSITEFGNAPYFTPMLNNTNNIIIADPSDPAV